MARGRGSDVIIRLSAWSILLGGRSHSIEAFDGLGVGRKQMRRILEELEQVPLMEVYQSPAGFWRCTFVPKGTQPQYLNLYCKGCGETKSTTDFYPQRDSATGFKFYCKECSLKYNKEYRKTEHYQKRYRKYARKYYLKNLERERENARNYYHRNKAAISQRRKERKLRAIQQNSKRLEN